MASSHRGPKEFRAPHPAASRGFDTKTGDYEGGRRTYLPPKRAAAPAPSPSRRRVAEGWTLIALALVTMIVAIYYLAPKVFDFMVGEHVQIMAQARAIEPNVLLADGPITTVDGLAEIMGNEPVYLATDKLGNRYILTKGPRPLVWTTSSLPFLGTRREVYQAIDALPKARMAPQKDDPQVVTTP